MFIKKQAASYINYENIYDSMSHFSQNINFTSLKMNLNIDIKHLPFYS